MVNTALRLSGVALIAGVLGAGGAVISLMVSNSGFAQGPADALLLVSAILLGLGWQGMYARQAEAAGWLGLVGHVLLQAGNVLIIVEAALPLVTRGATGLGESTTAFVLACALLLGFILTTVATLRARVFPRWSGILMAISSLSFCFAFFVADQLPAGAVQIGGIIFGTTLIPAFLWIGISLLAGGTDGRTAVSQLSAA